MRALSPSIGFLALLAITGPAFAQDYDFDWVTIDRPGNAAIVSDDPWGNVNGRGRVDHTYRISRLEVTTSQWMEFVNTFSTQANELKFFAMPTYWGATPDTSYGGPGRRWKLKNADDAGMRPVTGITWREAAQFCNWLNNSKPSMLSAIANGAYDTSTFGQNDDGTYTDQSAHNPGAEFWIPTLDEWLKAAHYDPSKDGTGGWWAYPNTSDTAPVPGIPGVGETSAGYADYGIFAGFDVALGSYPNTKTPWGLLDATGGASEWTESWYNTDPPHTDRHYDGAPAGEYYYWLDDLARTGAVMPWATTNHIGLRVVSIPSPTSLGLLIFKALFGREKRHATLGPSVRGRHRSGGHIGRRPHHHLHRDRRQPRQRRGLHRLRLGCPHVQHRRHRGDQRSVCSVPERRRRYGHERPVRPLYGRGRVVWRHHALGLVWVLQLQHY